VIPRFPVIISFTAGCVRSMIFAKSACVQPRACSSSRM
jgi:hypothetical protein